MLRVFRWAWRLVPWVVGAASIFGIPLPSKRGLALNWLTDFDLWVINHVAYPSVFALSVGVILGTQVVPGAWRLIQSHIDAPTPDMSVRDAVQHLYFHSKWVLGRADPRGDVLEQAGEIFRDAARLGHIPVWGRLKSGVLQSPISAISSEYWENAAVDLATCFAEQSIKPRSQPVRNGIDVFDDLRTHRNSVMAEWPRAFVIRRLMDTSRATRGTGIV